MIRKLKNMIIDNNGSSLQLITNTGHRRASLDNYI